MRFTAWAMSGALSTKVPSRSKMAAFMPDLPAVGPA
jgi:hypothetical protein